MLRVNGELIDPNLLEDAFARIKSEAEARLQVSCCERDPEFMTQAEEEVIDSVLIAQEAETRFPELPRDEIKARFEKTLQDYRKHGASWDMLEAQRENLLDECEANLRMEKFLDSVLAGKTDVSEDDLQAYYQANQREFRTVAEVRVLHLMKALEKHEDPVLLLEEMGELRETLVEGADFEQIAKAETEKESGEIDLGWITFDRPSNPIESIMFTMRLDEVSPVVAYEQSYHILKVAETKPATLRPFDEVREDLAHRVEFEKRRNALREFASGLREDATVERVDFNGDEEQDEEPAAP
ncbi:MAG: peptidylprolyl isomerase, partial [Verrucomicrobiota bacterium]|nr:peptidylprolyl isomerase [Verrucomicrobiota bacterium]